MCAPGTKEINPLRILPPDQFVKVPLKKIKGEVVWMNWDLLEQISPETRLNDRVMTPELQQSILDRYCKVIDEKGSLENAAEKGYADKYRMYYGDEREGSGRACHLETGESIKGVGKTVLAPRGEAAHSDGCVGFEEAVIEAAVGEACAHLFDNRTTRVLAILAPDKKWYEQPGQENHPLLIVRVGNHVRPAHFVHGSGKRPTSTDNPKLLNSAEKMFGETDSATLDKRLAEGHASIAARMQHRWRLLHGSPSESNMGVDGSLLDFGTFTSQPGTAPIFSMKKQNMRGAARTDVGYANIHTFGAEHKAHQMLALDVFSGGKNTHWPNAYREAKNIETFSALGIPENLSKTLIHQFPDDAHTLSKHIRLLGKFFYKEMSADSRENWDEATNASFADVHALLAKMPSLFFDHKTGRPKTVSNKNILQALNINPGGNHVLSFWEDWRERAPLKKYAIQDKKDGMEKIKKSLDVIKSLYPAMMQKAAEAGIQQGKWADFNEFLDCVTARAEFENAPLDTLYAPVIRGKIKDAIKRYEEEPSETAKQILFEEISSIIDQTISGTKRRVDDLLYNSPMQPGDEPDSYFLQMQKIDGILHYVEAKKNGERNICIELPVHLLGDGRQQIFNQEEGKTSQTKEKVLLVKQPAKPYQYGSLIGDVKVGDETLLLGKGSRQYTYAIPSNSELDEIIKLNKSTSEDLA